MNELSEFSLAAEFQSKNPNIVPKLDSLRWMIRHRYENGLSESMAVVKRQGRWYVHSRRFATWMLLGGDDHRTVA